MAVNRFRWWRHVGIPLRHITKEIKYISWWWGSGLLPCLWSSMNPSRVQHLSYLAKLQSNQRIFLWSPNEISETNLMIFECVEPLALFFRSASVFSCCNERLKKRKINESISEFTLWNIEFVCTKFSSRSSIFVRPLNLQFISLVSVGVAREWVCVCSYMEHETFMLQMKGMHTCYAVVVLKRTKFKFECRRKEMPENWKQTKSQRHYLIGCWLRWFIRHYMHWSRSLQIT